MTAAITLYFVRHGQTYLNHYHRFQGWSDSPLTAKGEQDAVLAGQRLAEVPFATAFSSDMMRAWHTAQLILDQSTVAAVPEIQRLPALREHFYGGLEALPQSQVIDAMCQQAGLSDPKALTTDFTPDELQELIRQADPTGEAETSTAFWQRFNQGLATIQQATPAGGRALIVTHSTVIMALAARLAPMAVTGLPDNGSVTLVTAQDGQLSLDQYNG